VPHARTLIGGLLGAAFVWALCCYFWDLPEPACWTAAISTLCAVWWIFEPIPIPATSLVPFAAFPLTGVLTHTEVAASYGHHLVLLFMGGFILSLGMEKSGAHRRIALIMVRAVGGRGGRRMVLGFMLASAFLSMWISNTATTLMLLPIVLAILAQAEDRSLAVPLLLGVAYAASIGGLGTPIGSPPNLVAIAVFEENTGQTLHFAEWMGFGLPVLILFLPLAWLWLTRGLRGSREIQLPELGPWRTAEVRVLTVFAITALLWMTRTQPNGGWNAAVEALWSFEGSGTLIGDSTVALLMAVVMFLVSDGKGGRLMDWDTAVRLPWGILLLFGGGLALAKAFTASGLSGAIGDVMQGLTTWHVLGLILVTCTLTTFLTEVTSNTATANVLMPVLAATAVAADIDPKLLMVPAALSCSCAFMLPVATPPNAIVFSTAHIKIRTMVREGLVLNLVGIIVVTTVSWLIAAPRAL
jgi:sodium-dependent dicarboxylate transporter 2/3/5